MSKYIGWIGLVLLQSNSIPLIYSAFFNGVMIAIQTPIMTIIGLSCYLYHSIKRSDILYTTGNLIGIISNSILIYILLRG